MNNTTFADVFDESQLETFLFRLRHFKNGTFLPLFSRDDTITTDKALLWRRWMRDLGLDDMAAELDPYTAMSDLIEMSTKLSQQVSTLSDADVVVRGDTVKPKRFVLAIEEYRFDIHRPDVRFAFHR